jgi:hypothetical protein
LIPQSNRTTLISKTTILVFSCDNYADVWLPFTTAWEKFWPECPFEIFLISEKKALKHHLIGNIQTGRPMRWGAMVNYALDQVKTPYIIYLQEDYLLRSVVEENRLVELIQEFEKINAAYLRLLPWPGPDTPHPTLEGIGILNPGSAYRTSLQAAIWDKDIFRSLIDPNDDGRFESWSVERANTQERPFLCLNRNGISTDINHDGDYPLNYFATSVFQGKWLKEAISLYKSLGIKIDTSQRGVMNRIDFLEYHERKKSITSLRYKAIRIAQKLSNIINFQSS